jgi:CubicO group peptidase (beta-lactamase class C family)
MGGALSGAGLLSALLLAAVPEIDSPAAQRIDDARAVRLLERHVVHERWAPGAVVAILDATGARLIARGQSGNPARARVDGETLFEIASITKTFTGVLLAEMALRGEVALGQHAAELAGTPLASPRDRITLEALATHRSGLPRLALDGAALRRLLFRRSDPYAGSTPAEIATSIAALAERAIRSDGSPRYSNLGFAWLGQLLAQRIGLAYEDALRQRVLRPLGLEDMVFEVAPEHETRLAVGHRDDLRRAAAWHLDAYNPAGGLKASGSAMLRYLEALASARFAPLAFATEARSRNGSSEIAGLGWALGTLDGTRLVWHNGGSGGFRSFIGYLPERGIGVAVLANSEASVDELALAILDPERTPEPPRRSARRAITALLLIAALIGAIAAVFVFQRRRLPVRTDRLQWLIVATGIALMLAALWVIGDWRALPLWLFHATAAVAAASLAYAALGARRAPWLVQRSRWRTSLRLTALALYVILIAMMLG